jgi:hypothetical protein
MHYIRRSLNDPNNEYHEMIKFVILNSNIDLMMKDNGGRTALDYVLTCGDGLRKKEELLQLFDLKGLNHKSLIGEHLAGKLDILSLKDICGVEIPDISGNLILQRECRAGNLKNIKHLFEIGCTKIDFFEKKKSQVDDEVHQTFLRDVLQMSRQNCLIQAAEAFDDD